MIITIYDLDIPRARRAEITSAGLFISDMAIPVQWRHQTCRDIVENEMKFWYYGT
jgi:hypothetical protein